MNQMDSDVKSANAIYCSVNQVCFKFKFELHLKKLSLSRNMHLYKDSCQSLKITFKLN